MDREQEWDKGWQKGHGSGDDRGWWTNFRREIGQEYKDILTKERWTATNNRIWILYYDKNDQVLFFAELGKTLFDFEIACRRPEKFFTKTME